MDNIMIYSIIVLQSHGRSCYITVVILESCACITTTLLVFEGYVSAID